MRADIGDVIAAGRAAFHQTFVAAGNRHINVIGPAYVPQIAQALGGIVGCSDRRSGAAGSPTCRTGEDVGRTPDCAALKLYDSDADRDRALRTALAYRGVPASLATSANWSINLCDYGLADRVARDLKGVVVRYDGQ